MEIRAAEAIDAQWMTDVLQAHGLDVTAANVAAKPVGTGQTGECTRFVIEYAQDSDHGPPALIGKFPSSDAASRRAGMAGGDYVREVKFYRDLAEDALVAVPQCYLAEIDEATGDFVLLLEDLFPARQGDQLQGVTIDQARHVVDQAARLHASHWNDPAIAKLDWIKLTPDSPHALPPGEGIRAACEGFLQRYGTALPSITQKACRRYAERVELYRSLPRPNKCLAHYDFRPDNMMFADGPSQTPVRILDWQTLSWAPGADDLAYFLAGALPPDLRRAHEPELLERYLAGLRALGVDSYGMGNLQRDYALGGFRLLATAMGGAMAVKRTERGDRMFLQMANSAAAHIEDHNGLEMLD